MSKMSKALEKEEAAKTILTGEQRIAGMVGTFDGLTPDSDGYYNVHEIKTFGDIYVIATFALSQQSSGGIMLPRAAQSDPDYGIIVGAPNASKDKLFKVVKFSSRHIIPCELDGIFPHFNGVPLKCVREMNLIVEIPPVKYKVIEVNNGSA